MGFCTLEAILPVCADGIRRVRCTRPDCGRTLSPTWRPVEQILVTCRSPEAHAQPNRRDAAHRSPSNQSSQQPFDLQHVTACITAYKRPDSLTRLLASLRRYYPQLTVDVEDTAGNLSAGRNRLVDRCATPLYLMLEDDFEFTEETKLEPLLEILTHDDELAGVGGYVCEGRQRRCWRHNFESFRRRASLRESWYPWRVSPGGRAYRPCHAILNFGLFRREALRRHAWDEQLPLSEHREWYYRVWQSGEWRMAFTPSVAIDHHRDRPHGYVAARQRTFHHVAEAKHDVRFELPEALHTSNRPNIVLLGVGHANTSITTRQIAALGWNLGDADEQFAESVAIRAVNQDYLRSREFDSFAAASALDRLPSPWVMKDPRFVYTLSAWLPLLVPRKPLLLWITKDTAAVEASYRRRGQNPAVVKPREQLCRQHFDNWPWAKLQLNAAQIAAAAALFDPGRHRSHDDCHDATTSWRRGPPQIATR